MSIIRSPRPNQAFTVIDNAVLRDDRLSMRALGLLVRLLSRPDNWETNSDTLAREFGCGREQMRSVLNELAEAGYMRLEKAQNAAGHWTSKWYVFDRSEPAEAAPKPGEQAPEQPGPGNPYVGEPGPSKKDRLQSTDTKEPPPTPPDGGKAQRKRSAADWVTVDALVADGVPATQAKAWLDFRRVKRVPLTAEIWTITKEEGATCGLAPGQLVRECLARSWAAFRADWMTPKAAGKPATVHSGFDQIEYRSGAL